MDTETTSVHGFVRLIKDGMVICHHVYPNIQNVELDQSIVQLL
jgi:hypothetical protein